MLKDNVNRHIDRWIHEKKYRKFDKKHTDRKMNQQTKRQTDTQTKYRHIERQ